MSDLGCIGYLMSGLVVTRLLVLVDTESIVPYIISGKANPRAIEFMRQCMAYFMTLSKVSLLAYQGVRRRAYARKSNV